MRDTSSALKRRVLAIPLALLSVGLLALPTYAATLSCAQNGIDIDCTYDFEASPAAKGQTILDYPDTPTGQGYAGLGPDAGTYTRSSACQNGNEHKNLFLCDDLDFSGSCNAGEDVASDDVQCVGGAICGDGNVDMGEECDDSNLSNGDGCSSSCTVETTLAYSPDEANGFLAESVTGTLGFFWDNIKGAMMVVASVGIVCGLFWWIYRTLKRRR